VERDHVGRRIRDALSRRPPGGTDHRQAINGGFELLEAKCNRCDRVSLVSLRSLRQVWKLEAALYREPCSKGRPYSRRQRAHILGLTYARPDPASPRMPGRLAAFKGVSR
jgi:hypothetical protein